MTTREWPIPSTHPLLAPDQVHVWRIPLDTSDGHDELAGGGLSDSELQRANRFRFDADRRRFVVRRAALRAILGAYLGSAGSEVVFSKGVHGKLFLDPRRHRAALRFNISHAHELALVGVSNNREIGVDIERCRSLPDIVGLTARCFTPREQSAFAAVPEPCRLGAFFGAWTLKEAYVKASGEGLSRNLDRVEVTIGAEAPVRLLAVLDRPGDEDRWTLHRLEPGESYVGALAAEGRGHQIQIWHWGPTLRS